MRNLQNVIDRIIPLIPDDFEYQEDLAAALEESKQNLAWAAPEAIAFWWSGTSVVLCEFLGTVDTAWKQEICNIFTDNEENNE